MHVFNVSAFAEVASFRVPESHTYQQTLPLPPITTLVGLAGAALGLEYSKTVDWFEGNRVTMGVWGKHRGAMRDLWKYTKVKDKETLKDVLLREALNELEILVVYGGEDRASVNQLREAFADPVFCLTAGTSDSLLKIREVSAVTEAQPASDTEFEHCVIPGNMAGAYTTPDDILKLPITEEIRAPQVFLLPTKFQFSGSERRVSRRDYFTFVGNTVRLNQAVPTFFVDETKVPLL